MKGKLLVLLIAVLLLAIVFSGCFENKGKEGSSNNLEYINDYLKFGINPPSGYETNILFNTPTEINFYNITTEEKYSPYLTITLLIKPICDKTLKEHVDFLSLNLSLTYKKTTINYMNAYERTYSYNNSLYKINFTTREILVSKYGKIFSLIYEASSSIYDKYYPIFNESINSFTIFEGSPYDELKVGETVKYEGLEVTILSVNRTYSCSLIDDSTGETYTDYPQTGKIFIILDINVKNTDNESKDISTTNFIVDESHSSISGNIGKHPTPNFESKTLEKNEVAKGLILYEVSENAVELKAYFYFDPFFNNYPPIAIWDLGI